MRELLGQLDITEGGRIFCAGGDRPPVQAMTFIDDSRGVYEVEPMCKVLPIAPSTHHKHIAQQRCSGRLSARAQRDKSLSLQSSACLTRTLQFMVSIRCGGR